MSLVRLAVLLILGISTAMRLIFVLITYILTRFIGYWIDIIKKVVWGDIILLLILICGVKSLVGDYRSKKVRSRNCSTEKGQVIGNVEISKPVSRLASSLES